MSEEELRKEIEKLKDRNRRVETDKAWETSWTRRVIIFILTYSAIVVYFHVANLPDPLVNSLVPALAFVISTLSMPYFKNIWEKKTYKK